MTNSMLWLANAALWFTGALVIAIMTTCAIPHDFGMHNNLKTICHVWKDQDGHRGQATVHINSSKNTHESHHWDYDGRCEE